MTSGRRPCGRGAEEPEATTSRVRGEIEGVRIAFTTDTLALDLQTAYIGRLINGFHLRYPRIPLYK